MNITSKSRYALKIMIDLAESAALDVGGGTGGTAADAAAGASLIHRADIATRQGIPLEYMDQILSRLREAGLVVSTRGRRGGYQLGQRADGISMLEIFRTVEDAWNPVACLDDGGACLAEHVCSTRDTWSLISGAIGSSLSGILLSDVLARRVPVASDADALALAGIQECRAPRRRLSGQGGAKFP